MPTIEAVAERIVGAGLPVFFLDTCTLLDIIRSIHRCLPRCAERGADLLAMATGMPPGCLVVVSSIVPLEWGTHEQDVTDEADRHLKKVEEQAVHFHEACRALGIAPGFDRGNYASVGLADGLRDLSRRLLDAAVRLDADDESRVRAVNRVVGNLPPSRKGAEVKDCTIIEECLAVCRKLHAAGFAAKRVFCTSNVNDYCDPSKHLHPILALEFSAVGLTFTANLPHAFHELTN